MATTRLLLITGETCEVDGSLEEVARVLQNAARSSPGTLAWVEQSGGGEPLGVNPAQLVWIRRGRD
jgi:hypothetical protein